MHSITKQSTTQCIKLLTTQLFSFRFGTTIVDHFIPTPDKAARGRVWGVLVAVCDKYS